MNVCESVCVYCWVAWQPSSEPDQERKNPRWTQTKENHVWDHHKLILDLRFYFINLSVKFIDAFSAPEIPTETQQQQFYFHCTAAAEARLFSSTGESSSCRHRLARWLYRITSFLYFSAFPLVEARLRNHLGLWIRVFRRQLNVDHQRLLVWGAAPDGPPDIPVKARVTV